MDSKPKYLKLISCKVFQREISSLISKTHNIIDAEFLEIGLHAKPELLRKVLQEKIDASDSITDLNLAEQKKVSTRSDKKNYEAILLCYGLCGNAINGLKASNIPLVIPRAHDCCTILLGSKKKFLAEFKDNFSAPWSSAGYLERQEAILSNNLLNLKIDGEQSYKTLAQSYGEENADFLWENIHNNKEEDELIFIDTEETQSLPIVENFKKKLKEENKSIKIIKGSSILIKKLVSASWTKEDFLIVEKGKEVLAIYDHNKIIYTN